MVAISIFLMFGIALAVVYVEHYYDVSISKLITWVCMAITIATVAAFLWYPYHTVSFDERVAHIYMCTGVVMCCLITMVAAAYIDART